MIRGGTPATALPSTRARGDSPWRLAARLLASRTAPAPSLIPDELPAVTDPCGVTTHPLEPGLPYLLFTNGQWDDFALERGQFFQPRIFNLKGMAGEVERATPRRRLATLPAFASAPSESDWLDRRP